MVHSQSGSNPGRPGIRVFKIVVLGEGGVGKSALTLQFVSHRFLEYHDPTIEDAYQQQAVIDGEAAKLDILDTAGQVEFTAMRDQYMRGGEGFVLCYSITDRRSFEEVQEYRRLISKVRACDDIPLVLVGNKFDLADGRKVTSEEGQLLAGQFGCPFFETSAALRHYVDDAFYALVREIRRREVKRSGGASGSSSSGAGKIRSKLAASGPSSPSASSDSSNQGSQSPNQKRRSRWRRFRNIFAFIFRRKQQRRPLE